MRDVLAGDSPVSFLASDHLGSTTLTVWANGTVRTEVRYDPWGKECYAQHTTPTGYHYTSQRWDNGLGLYDYNARYYDPHIGRFISADVIVPGAAAPQAFNRYAYVLGNPLRYSDPTGHLTEDEVKKYFGLTYDEAIGEWGEKLTNLVFNEFVNWGAVLDYDDGSVMLLLAYSGENDHRFRAMAITQTGAKRSVKG